MIHRQGLPGAPVKPPYGAFIEDRSFLKIETKRIISAFPYNRSSVCNGRCHTRGGLGGKPNAMIRMNAFTLCFGVSAFLLPLQAGAGIPVKGYSLAWSDEFNGSALDTSKWGFRDLGPRREAVNTRESVFLDGEGHLVLFTSRSGEVIHTAMIGTEGRFETAFGYFECRVRLQQQVGHWSAFWLQSPAMGRIIGNTAQSGAEIDIFEYMSKRADTVQHTLHWDGYAKDHASAECRSYVPGLAQGWHIFGLLWTEDEYVFYVDGKVTWRINEAISKRNQYIILSLEVGNWAGDIRQARLPDPLFVDYVRVYKKRGAGTAEGNSPKNGY